MSTHQSAAPRVTASCGDDPSQEANLADYGVPISSLWQRKCKAAEREKDPRKLSELIKEADLAISGRLQQLAGKQTPERAAIAKAVVALRQLNESKLNFPTWKRGNKTSSLLAGNS